MPVSMSNFLRSGNPFYIAVLARTDSLRQLEVEKSTDASAGPRRNSSTA